ncbi:hypothetical protein [Polaribacter sp. Hel1_85]|uniref:hypothetical protein n=1 Tax=Polaribacter sp. Hel1_85 TaxID=1250005 RepID=UPI00055A1E8E|nr:hypothetical protein [Polaribacter sp. Hel1_85]
MILNTNHKTLTTLLVLSIFFVNTTNAQFWKKLKNKVQQKVENKIEKEADKKIDSLLEGKKKAIKKEAPKTNTIDDRLKSYGSASINHSNTYPTIKISHVSRAKVNKIGNKFKIKGHWGTTSADVFDGYNITIKNTSLEDLKQGKTFQIPSEANLYIGYDPLLDERENRKELWKGAFENKVESGTITVKFVKDNSLSISFSANGTLSKYIETNRQLEEGYYDKKPMTIDGFVTSSDPEYTITRETKTKEKDPVDTLTEDEKMEMLSKALPTVKIPSTFSFNKGIKVKMTDDRGDAQTVEFFIGKYPDIYGMSVAPKEMQGQEMLIVNTPKAMTMFMNMGGMKIKKSTSIEQMGDQYNMEDKIPEEGDFEYKKTGKTKTIIGYLCEEVKVDYNYTNQKGSTSFWISKKFPIQNKALPMLGMKMNNPNFSGFVLEMNTIQNGKKFTIEVIGISDKNVSINTNDYKKMGF